MASSPQQEIIKQDQECNYTHTFRILDIGSHDGFVSLWLARQMRERYVKVEICGMELHPGAVEIARRRADAEGFDHEYHVGLGDLAEKFWDWHTFDAVIAYEVIEHVPDVDKFLSMLDRMCKPDGRVYLSTPTGTFGTGNNPHHLRVFRPIDLFDTIRRRGFVQQVHEGVDGVTVASYTPGDAAITDVTVYCGPGWEKWHPNDITEKGLGGSETAAASIAEELANQGCNVTLYGEVDTGIWGQVLLRNHTEYDPMEKQNLTIISRNPHILDRKVNSDTVLFWMHDTDYGDQLTQERMEQVANVLTLSNWHFEHVKGMYPWLEDKLQIVNNGINPDFFPADKLPVDRPRRAIFSSSPDRGLDFLVKLWPRVREQVPDAELVYCYSSVYDKIAQTNPALAEFRSRIDAQTNPDDGLVNLGSLSQDALASAMAMCRLWLHPSYNGLVNARFHETFCIGAVESAAAGCHRIMSDWGALSERREGDYTYIPDLDEDAWVEAIVKHLLDDSRFYHSFPEARRLTWSEVAVDMLLLHTGVPVAA